MALLIFAATVLPEHRIQAGGGPSNAVINLVQGAPGVATLKISGTPGQVYGIQAAASPNPSASWAGLFNFTQPGSNRVWTDPQPETLSARFYRVAPGPVPVGAATWEAADIGAVWSDKFDRAALGSNWVVMGGANAGIVGNELRFAETNKVTVRQVYYDPWQICSDAWTLRWTQRFGALDAASLGVGAGLKNFQAFGGDDRGYNLLLPGAGTNLGKVQIECFDGSNQTTVATGPAMVLSAGDQVDCSFTRTGWTMTATASNRANSQVSSVGIIVSDAAMLDTPVISRACLYPLGGTVYVDNVSFAIDHRKPARFVLVGGSSCEGWNASSVEHRFINVIQSNYAEAVCNDSASYNVTSDTVSVLPEIIAHQPGTAILMIGGNDLYFNVPSNQWQSNYSTIVTQLQAAGVYVKHCLPPPRNTEDLRPLKDWILANFPSNSIIDTWTPFVTNVSSLKIAYDSGDGVHPNDAGHLLIGQIIRTNLP